MPVMPEDEDDPLDEITGTHSATVPGLDVARHLSEVRRTLKTQTAILRAVEGYLERLTTIEEERTRRGTLLRSALEALRNGADRVASLVERLLEVQVLGALGVIARYVGMVVVALACIAYGVSLTGWGVTLGTAAGEALMSVTSPPEPVDTGVRNPPAPPPGEPRPSP